VKPTLFVSLAFVVTLSACGSSSTPSGPDTDAGDAGRSPDGAAPLDGSSPDSGGKVDAAIDSGSPGAGCTTPSDCRAYSNDCDGCTCLALAADATDPVCPGSPVSCIVDPCQGKKATCEGGTCVIRAQ
jgi:hypothetical protein